MALVEAARQMLLFLLIVFNFCCDFVSSDYALKVLRDPADCYGGQPCLTQPQLGIYTSDGEYALSFTGFAYVQMGASPSGSESLYLGTCDYQDDCISAKLVSGPIAEAYFEYGVATFDNLMIRSAGDAYTLQYNAKLDGVDLTTSATSGSFPVSVGDAFKLKFHTEIGVAKGGVAFQPNPVVAIVDRGDNPVTSISSGDVRASLVDSPGGTEQLLPAANRQATFIDGYATFDNLYINESGSTFQISFNTSYSAGIPDLLSTTFAVAVGSPYFLAFDEDFLISSSTVRAGEFFKVAPRIKILDKGLNLVSTDSSSKIEVSISGNPSGSTLLPLDSTSVVAKEGLASFSSLSLDKVGTGYTLLFTYYSYDGGTGLFTEFTDITLTSESFDVLYGAPRKLLVSQLAAGAIGGGDAFTTQPIVHVTDYGDNVLTKDFSTVVAARLVSSLSASTVIRIDTYTTAQTTVSAVGVGTADGTYGVGEEIYLHVYFEYEVTMLGGADAYIALNVVGSGARVARLHSAQSIRRTKVLTFKYVVAALDSATKLDYSSTSSLFLNGSSLVDGNNVTVDTSLPSYGLGRNHTINIDSSSPYVVAIGVDKLDGEYGVGEEITFNVTYSQPVFVVGKPFLRLNMTTSSGYYYDSSDRGSSRLGAANYSSTSAGGYTVFFTYTVGEGHYSTDLSIGSREIGNGSTSRIFRLSTSPTALANHMIPYSLIEKLRFQNKIVIDSSRPALNTSYGVRTSKADGTYYVGESILVSVRFTKPVVVQGSSIQLELQTRSTSDSFPLPAFFSHMGNDSMTMYFSFSVLAETNTTRLDISGPSALTVTGEDSYIRRAATSPTLAANLSTAAIYSSNFDSLRSTARIALDGFSPTVTSALVVRVTGSDRKLFPDDQVYINVTFSAPVVTSCSPVFTVDAGFSREALFVSGSGTRTFLFVYTVAVGDRADFLAYSSATALCLEAGCPSDSTSSCYLRARSTVPTAPVSRTLSLGSAIAGRVLIGNYSVSPSSQTRNTTIRNITASLASGEYGAGTTIQFFVTFTDEVLYDLSDVAIANVVPPRLYLNIDRFAEYAAGIGSNTLTFTYTSESNDSTTNLKAAWITGTQSPLYCYYNQSCALQNLAGIPVALNCSGGALRDTGIALDATPPRIVAVWSNKTTSPYDGNYTAGEEIYIKVRFDKPVQITGSNPRLKLDVGRSTDAFAAYDATGSSSTVLDFLYTVEAGDHSPELAALGPSLDDFFGLSYIYRTATVLTTIANYSLAGVLASTGGRLSVGGNSIAIETRNPPEVLTVRAVSAEGSYFVGDEIIIRVEMSKHVVLDSHAYIHLNAGDRIAEATYLSYNYSADVNYTKVVTLPTPATKELFFKYKVGSGDFSPLLDVIDSFSFFVGLTPEGGVGTMLHASTAPTIAASTVLPAAGANKTIANSTALFVDGGGAYVTHMSFATDRGTYGVGADIYISVNFSRPVYVEGRPFLTLETGDYDRTAAYDSGSGSSQLLFKYTAQPGDSTPALDYRVDRAALSSAAGSVDLNGGRVLVHSSNPTLPVDIHLNPVSGVLGGDTEATVSYGVSSFLDLGIGRRGPDYRLIFEATPDGERAMLASSQDLYVSFSSEFSLCPADALKHDLVGYDVGIDGDTAVIGAPNSNLSVNAVQTFSTIAAQKAAAKEVQVIRSSVEPQPAIQTFHTTADVGETVGGSFKISYGDHGTSRAIPCNADGPMLKAMLEYDLPVLGAISVERRPYIFCACEGAFTWVVTFADLVGGSVGTLAIDHGGLTGRGASVSAPSVVQAAALLRGSFSLSYEGSTAMSSAVRYDASAVEIANAIRELNIGVSEVDVSSADIALSRSWTVTFDTFSGSYDVPLLRSDASALTGGLTRVWHSVLRPGVHAPGGLGGHFQLEWRGNTTRDIPYNASATEVQLALEELPVINAVSVSRSEPSSINEFTWTVELQSVNSNSPRGYYEDVIANLEPLVPHSSLIGTDAHIVVRAKWGLDSSSDISSDVTQGSFGAGAGAAYIYQKIGEGWQEVFRLEGNTSDEGDRFGSSVDIHSYVAVVGAVGADFKGQAEVQSIYCSADTGSFRLRLRGWTSAPIDANSTAAQLQSSLQSDSASFSGLHGATSLTVSFEKPYSTLCSNNTAFITFNTPVDTFAEASSDGEYEGSNLALLAVVEAALGWRGKNSSAGGVAVARKVHAGTNTWHGLGSNAQQVGCAYIFRLANGCAANASECVYDSWVQEARLYPPTNIGSGSRFSHAVSIYADTVAIGAPGSSSGRGAVFVYLYSNGTWVLSQELEVMELVSGDNFGHSIDMHENTMVVSAPYSSTGVYVYKRSSARDAFIATQILLPTKTTFAVTAAEMFGGSVAVHGDTVAVGAYERSGMSLYLGSEEHYAEKAGAVFIFTRVGFEYDFAFLHQVKATNVRRNDRFGYDLALNANRLVVTSIESFDGELMASKAIVKIQSIADYNMEKLGSSFSLSWEASTTGGESSSRAIPYNCSAALMKNILEEDLSTGSLLVSRTSEDVYNGGYIWTVTFLATTTRSVPLFTADTTFLTGTNARVEVTYANESPAALRGKAHVFQRNSAAATELFVEQAFLSPSTFQPVDRCGLAVGITAGDAIVGCPNRDANIPDKNSGKAFVFNLDTLDVQFERATYSTNEGGAAVLGISLADLYDGVDKDVLFYLKTIDRNSDSATGTFISHLYGISEGQVVYPQTTIDFAGIAGAAIARTQFYGSTHNESVWVDGMYDYRGISDYLPTYEPLVLLSGKGSGSISYELQTTSDTILENPDETISIGILSPGLWPSPLGALYSMVTIEDDGDGTSGNTTLHDKMYASPLATSSQLGSSVAVDDSLGVIFAGAPLVESGGMSNGGCVVFYRYLSSVHMWTQRSMMFSPTPGLNHYYGDEVVVKTVRNGTALLVVGEPGANRVHVYSSTATSAAALGAAFSLETTLSVDEAYLFQHRFGARGTIALDGFLLAVGAPGLETVYLFARSFDEAADAWAWSSGKPIRSTDYDYDVIRGVVNLHAQDFGRAVALSGRTLLVGAPYADYGKLGTDLVEVDWKTDGDDIRGYGRGRAYVFSSSPAVVAITLEALRPLSAGTFKLVYSHLGINTTTTGLSAESTDSDVKTALEALSNMNDILVSSSSDSVAGVGFQYRWTVTFLSEFVDFGALAPVWNNYSCDSCVPFDTLSLDPDTQVSLITTHEIGAIVQHATLEASDKHSGNKFGWSVAIEADQVAVGAVHSASISSVTWDFEAGSLRGWSATGTAFDHQPTYGDNSYYRAVDPGADLVLRLDPQSSRTRPEGLYYVGSYERRRGSATNYLLPDQDYPAGGYQGDEPVGTLTSEVFMILGAEISFLVGGGCDYSSEYVELLVDGLSVLKETGRCEERMRRVTFDVSLYHGRAGQIRIVDDSRSNWGHINVDDFRFAWDVKGRVLTGENEHSSSGGRAESPRSGAVYMYRRHLSATSDNACSDDYFSCVWTQETRLTASDKRPDTFFGSSLALNDKAGVLVVGSPWAPLSGFYKETPSAYPYRAQDGTSSAAAGVGFPAASEGMPNFQSQPLHAPSASGASGVWQLRSDADVSGDAAAHTAGGAVYIFTKEKSVVSSTGEVEIAQHWYPTEKAKLQPPDGFARDYFGCAVAISEDTLVVGATGQDGIAADGGAVYFFDSKFAALSFSEVEYAVLEGTDSVATVTLLRDSTIYEGDVYIEYATSDLTAMGVDSYKYTECLGLAASERGPSGCGDYQQTSGVLYIAAGVGSAAFQINIINDNCYERYMKFVQVTIAVPGSAALQGGAMVATVRIDDDDYLQEACDNLP